MCHLNTELAPPSSVEGYCHIDIFDPPGVTTPSASSETGSLVDLIERYMNEVLHNVYCHRLFIWEQVSHQHVLFGQNHIFELIISLPSCVTFHPTCIYYRSSILKTR